MSALDIQVGGSHYKKNAIQPIQYTTANCMGPSEMNIIKYVTRYKDKNGVEDLRKVRHYIDLHAETVASEPALFRELRAMMATKDLFPIKPDEYCVANGLRGTVGTIITLVTYWRHDDCDPCVVDTVRRLVEELIDMERDNELQDHDREQTQDRR